MKIKLPDGTIKELSSVSKAKETEGKKETEMDTFNRRFEESKARIAERGTIQSEVSSGLREKNLGGYIKAATTILSAPLDVVESALSNPMLELQMGNTNISDLGKASLQGLMLQEKGQYGDVLKNAGVNPIIADATGLFLNIGGFVKAASSVNKTFGSISKLSDKGIMRAGKNLITATQQAKVKVGEKVTQAFAKFSDDLVDGVGFLDEIIKLPKSVIKKAEEVFGNMDEFAENLTVGKLREFKQFVGKLRPSSFGKSDVGIVENIDIQDLNKGYAGIKNLLKNTLKESRGEKVSSALMVMEDHFSEISNASRFIRKAINDPILRKPTKGGKVAQAIAREGDVSTRQALNTIKQVGGKARNSINRAMRDLSVYNRHQFVGSLAQSAVKAAVFGGAAGAIGGKVLQRLTEKE